MLCVPCALVCFVFPSENGAIVATAYGALLVVFVPCVVMVCYSLSDVMR